MLSVLVNWIRIHLPQSERGQDLIEYAMLGGLIALAIIGVGVAALTGALNNLFDGIGRCIDFQSGGCDPF
jgi:Flp pilus assembly pilin Flp